MPINVGTLRKLISSASDETAISIRMEGVWYIITGISIQDGELVIEHNAHPNKFEEEED